MLTETRTTLVRERMAKENAMEQERKERAARNAAEEARCEANHRVSCFADELNAKKAEVGKLEKEHKRKLESLASQIQEGYKEQLDAQMAAASAQVAELQEKLEKAETEQEQAVADDLTFNILMVENQRLKPAVTQLKKLILSPHQPWSNYIEMKTETVTVRRSQVEKPVEPQPDHYVRDIGYMTDYDAHRLGINDKDPEGLPVHRNWTAFHSGDHRSPVVDAVELKEGKAISLNKSKDNTVPSFAAELQRKYKNADKIIASLVNMYNEYQGQDDVRQLIL